jgi:hypothetical protein
MMDAVVDRLHAALVQALRERGTDALNRPVTVAEIYQDLIPYRVVRGTIGVELNADYEHALLRLLAGYGGLVRLEPESAREELEREIDSPNPNLGLYRKFAACDVWVSAARDGVGPVISPESLPVDMRVDAQHAMAVEAPAPVFGLDADVVTAPLGYGPKPAESSTPATGIHAEAAEACPFCAKALPSGRPVRFCPYCGGDQRFRPCAACGEALEPAWRYCIACGTAV